MPLRAAVLALLLLLQLYRVHDQPCGCDPARPESMAARECGLCREAERQAPGIPYFFLKDNNPRKPNRWLILPREHSEGMHRLQMGEAQSAAFWKAAAEKASSLWGDQWGLAVNGARSRTQCHGHVHIGRLLDDARLAEQQYLLRIDATPAEGKPPVDRPDPEHLRIPARGEGFWVHPSGGVLHMHVEDPAAACEFVLMR